MLIEIVTEHGVSLIAATGMALCLGGMMSTRRAMQARLKDLETHLNDMSSELQTIGNGSMGMGRKLQVLEQKAMKISDKVTEIQKNDPTKVSYSEAARLVSMGASVEDLMNACGISRPEAELVTALTKNESNTANENQEHDIPQLDTRA